MYVEIEKRNLKKNIPPLSFCGCFIAGGCIRDSILNVDFDDIDVFGITENLDLFRTTNLSDWKLTYDSEKLKSFRKGKNKIQLIYKDFATMEQCLDQFDFTICQFSLSEERLICNPESIIHLFEKKLVINKLPFPYDTMRRMQKYIKRGYSICNGGLKEIGDAIRSLDQEKYDEQVTFYPDKSIRLISFD